MKNTAKITILAIIFLLGLFIGRLTITTSITTITRTGTSDFKMGMNKIITLLEQIEKNTKK